jgi:hypothetical protein
MTEDMVVAGIALEREEHLVFWSRQRAQWVDVGSRATKTSDWVFWTLVAWAWTAVSKPEGGVALWPPERAQRRRSQRKDTSAQPSERLEHPPWCARASKRGS